jgi:hypothetical protein
MIREDVIMDSEDVIMDRNDKTGRRPIHRRVIFLRARTLVASSSRVGSSASADQRALASER